MCEKVLDNTTLAAEQSAMESAKYHDLIFPKSQSDRDVAELIAKLRTPPGFNWADLANDIETVLKVRRNRAGWQPIETYAGADREKVDLWLHIYASPRSMGMSDSFRVIECWRVDGKWFHFDGPKEKEIFFNYITHWMPPSESPTGN